MKAKAANGIGPGAGKGVRAEVEARAIRNAKQRERVRDVLPEKGRRDADCRARIVGWWNCKCATCRALVNDGDWFARMQVAAEVRHA